MCLDKRYWQAESKADWPDETRGSRLEAHGGQVNAGKTEEDTGKGR